MNRIATLPVLLIAAYAVLVAVAIVWSLPVPGAIAAWLLASLILLSTLRAGRAWAWLAWLALTLGIGTSIARGHAELVFDAIPVLINAAVCGVFAATLRRGRQPLIARAIRVLEGPERLASPGVARYARQLTTIWALVLALQTLLLALLWLCAVPRGALASFGIAAPLTFPETAAHWYLHFGSYVVVAALFALEYPFRRWHLRHVPHDPLPRFVARLARHWPALVRGHDADAQEPRRP